MNDELGTHAIAGMTLGRRRLLGLLAGTALSAALPMRWDGTRLVFGTLPAHAGTSDAGPDAAPDAVRDEAGMDATPEAAGPEPTGDAGTEANNGSEASAEAGPDEGMDTATAPEPGPEPTPDAGPEAGPDTGPDTGPDAIPEAGEDVGPDIVGPPDGPVTADAAAEASAGSCGVPLRVPWSYSVGPDFTIPLVVTISGTTVRVCTPADPEPASAGRHTFRVMLGSVPIDYMVFGDPLAPIVSTTSGTISAGGAYAVQSGMDVTIVAQRSAASAGDPDGRIAMTMRFDLSAMEFVLSAIALQRL